jgi:hypothetical protein
LETAIRRRRDRGDETEEDFYDTRSPTPSRELQQHKWSCSGSSLSGRVIASVRLGSKRDARHPEFT